MTELTPVARLDARLIAHDWAWARDNTARIAANWERRRAATPAIFNGRILMIARMAVEPDGSRATIEFFAADYAVLLAHADLGFEDAQVANGFAMGALAGRDGGFLLAEMSAGTANAGRLYFAAGTPDLSDVTADGTVDLAGSILREIREETGLTVGPDALAPGWVIARHEGRVGFMRGVRLHDSADSVRVRILAHIAAESEPELADVVILRDGADIDREAARMPAFLPPYLRAAMAEAQR